MDLQFKKYHGAGNDFIITEQSVMMDLAIHKRRQFISALCHRRFGIGADGFFVVDKSSESDLQLYFFNSDGKKGSFCGNGTRCALQFALDCGLIQSGIIQFKFWDQTYIADCNNDSINIRMKNINLKVYNEFGFFTDTGSPHMVVNLESGIENRKELLNKALELRYHSFFQPDGTNINFLYSNNFIQNLFKIETFERGVEDFTYACGTGAVAVAAYLAWETQKGGEFNISSRGGMLCVKIGEYSESQLSEVWLSGPVAKIFEGKLENSFLQKILKNIDIM